MKSSQNFRISMQSNYLPTFRLCKLSVTLYILPARGESSFPYDKTGNKKEYYFKQHIVRKHILILKQKLWLCIWLSWNQTDYPSFCGWWSADRQSTNPGTNNLWETEIQLPKSLSAGHQSARCALRDHDSVGLPWSEPGVYRGSPGRTDEKPACGQSRYQ